MDTVSPVLATRSVAPDGPVLARPLTPGEWSHLERLRAWLRNDGTDPHDAAALDARWGRLLADTSGDAPAAEGVAAAIGIAVGDLLVAAVPGVVWMMCPGPEGATPGVLHERRPHMPVLPVLDAQARRRTRVPAWTVDYVARASAHLHVATPGVPSPHPSPEASPTPPRHGAHALPDAPLDEGTWPSEPAPVAGRHGREPDTDPSAFFVARRPTSADTVATPVEAVVDPITDAPVSVADGTDPLVPAASAAAGHAADGAAGPTLAWVGAPATEVPPAVADHAATTPDDLDADTNPTPAVAPAAPRAAAPATPGRGVRAGDRPLTPDDLPYRPSERVQDLALRALELALERAVRGDCAPFVLTREAHEVEVVEFEASDAGVAQAREAARRGGWSAAAIAWTTPADDTRPFPRVVVDASAAGRPGIRVAHAFAQDELGAREVGGPEVVGQAAPVL